MIIGNPFRGCSPCSIFAFIPMKQSAGPSRFVWLETTPVYLCRKRVRINTWLKHLFWWSLVPLLAGYGYLRHAVRTRMTEDSTS